MQTVKVRLRKPSRVFTFLCNNIPLGREVPCVVRSDRGLEYGISVMAPEECTPEEQKRLKMTVVRKATHHDQTTYQQIQYDERMAKQSCTEKIHDRDLAMKLVETEYTFDRRKIIFYFTAEERVDFRELVRELAKDLKARIELRHIQVRDQAKMIGGIGTCGRELCCTTWMREFVPISMKMAKRQNLSLNPTKISGQCGRLMCCLSYENELYSRAKRDSRSSKAPDPKHLEKLQDEMSADAEKSAKVLKETSLKDVADRGAKGKAKERSERPRRNRRRDRSRAHSERDSKPKVAASEARPKQATRAEDGQKAQPTTSTEPGKIAAREDRSPRKQMPPQEATRPETAKLETAKPETVKPPPESLPSRIEAKPEKSTEGAKTAAPEQPVKTVVKPTETKAESAASKAENKPAPPTDRKPRKRRKKSRGGPKKGREDN